MLSRRWIINCALVLLIVGLITTALRLDQKPENQQSNRISSLQLDDINSIQLDYAEESIRLRRDNNGWHIESPIDWPAHSANVRRLLGILSMETPQLAAVADVDLAGLGLASPIARLRLNDTELLFGAVNNIGERRYLMLDNRIYLLPDIHLAFIAQGLSGMVERQLLPKHYPIARLRLPTVEIARDTNGQWTSEPTQSVSQSQLQSLIDNWQGLPASRVKPFDLNSSARQVIELQLQTGENVDFLLLATEPELVIANTRIDMQYHFLRDYADQLLEIPAPASTI